jgi:O-antigen/teichoic acid export membrane protein
LVLVSQWKARLQKDERLGRILHGGASGIASKTVTLLASAISLPLAVRYLGRLEFGIWVTISTSAVMLSVLDLGIANTLTNFISRAYANDDEAMAQRYFATALWGTISISIVLGVSGLAVFHWIDWGALFRLQDAALVKQVHWAVALCFLFFLLGLPLNLANKVLSGYQEVHLSNYFAMLNGVLGLVAIAATVMLRGSLVMLTAAYCSALLLSSVLLNLWLYVWHRPGVVPRPSAVTLALTRELFGKGALFFVLQLSGLVVFNSDNLVISHYLGPAEVTPYSVAWRLCGYAAMFQSMLVPSLWPAFSEAFHRGDYVWVRTTYRRLMRGSLLAVGAAAVVIGLLGRPLIRVWAGPSAVPGVWLLWLMCCWVVLLSYTVNQAMLLAATQRIRVQAIYSAVTAVANLIVTIVLVQRIGAIGVLLGTVISYILFVLVPQAYETRAVLRGARHLEKAMP